MKLSSKSLINYYGEIPNNYNISFIHCQIDLVDDSKEESELVLRDLLNIKNYVSEDLFKIYFSNLKDLKILVNNTNILDILSNDIYVRIRNNKELDELRNIVKDNKLNIIVDYNKINSINIVDTYNTIVQVDTIKELSCDQLDELNKKYGIKYVCLGQMSYLGNYYLDYLHEMGDYFKIPRLKDGSYDYFNIEKEVSLSNDIYTIEEYKKIYEKLISFQKDIKENDSLITKLFKVYKNIITSIKYNYDGVKNDELDNQNLIGGLFKNTCVCEGYSKIIKQAFSLFGVETIVVGGGGAKEDGGHVWNQVKIKDTWYNVDGTIDSINLQNGKDIENFLVKGSLYKANTVIAKECVEDYNHSL